MYDFVSRRKWLFLLSAVLVVAGLIAVATGGLTMGIEFDSGSKLEIGLPSSVGIDDLEEALDTLGYEEALGRILRNDDNFLITTREISGAEKNDLIAGLRSELNLEEDEVVEEGFRIVDPEIASETLRNAAIAVAVAAVAVLLYVSFAFRKMPSPFRYGACAIIALLHDMFITVGMFALLGSVFNWEVNPMFIVAMLAVIGYSVNDTIVVFDRIRENLNEGKYPDFRTTVNASLTQTLTRSLCTSLTTILVVLSLYLFVGTEIRNFVVALLIGLIAGTYSSIFIASQLLLVWEEGEWRKRVPDLPVVRRWRTA